MSLEEHEAIAQLLAPDRSQAKRKAILKWFSEYLEEGYILNLPPSKEMIRALETFSAKEEVEAALRTRAKNLIKKYHK